MLTPELLLELKTKMPSKYVAKVIRAYKSDFNEDISRWTVMRFFKGETYSEELHSAILTVARMQQTLISKTTEVVNG